MNTEQALKNAGATYFGENFKKWFFPLDLKKRTTKKLSSKKLPRSMNDESIIRELNPGEVWMEEIIETLKTMDHDVWALFYCKDKDGGLRTVNVNWNDDGWNVNANDVTNPNTWNDVRQVFSRNFRSTKALSTSDPLTLGHFEARLKKLEEFQKSVEKVIKL